MNVFRLNKLACGHRVKSVTEALLKTEGVESVRVDENYAVVKGNVETAILIKAIVDAGYEANSGAEPIFTLQLKGLVCEHCVEKIETEFDKQFTAAVFSVEKNEAKFYSDVDKQQVIEAVNSAGYRVG